MIKYPQIDPVIFEIGPFAPRWYGLAYLTGFACCYLYLRRYWQWLGLQSKEQVDSVLGLIIFAMLIGSRFTYVVFYNWDATMQGPWWEPFAVWHGGLSFHGGFVGMLVGCVIAAKRYNIELLRLFDLFALAAPVGLGLGRVTNFINGELYGRVTNVAWGMIFPGAGPHPRHPSQLYEAFLEGPVLMLIVHIFWWKGARVGVLGPVFAFGYASFRIFVEFFREPDAQLGFLYAGATMGQLLSITMFVIGGAVLYYALKQKTEDDIAYVDAADKQKAANRARRRRKKQK